jgi:hypothetical protein
MSMILALERNFDPSETRRKRTPWRCTPAEQEQKEKVAEDACCYIMTEQGESRFRDKKAKLEGKNGEKCSIQSVTFSEDMERNFHQTLLYPGFEILQGFKYRKNPREGWYINNGMINLDRRLAGHACAISKKGGSHDPICMIEKRNYRARVTWEKRALGYPIIFPAFAQVALFPVRCACDTPKKLERGPRHWPTCDESSRCVSSHLL